jgi:O-antigen biosynthesis protein WbqP
MVKRLFDICLSGSALLFLAPLGGLIALLVILTSKGPAFYWSQRVGAGNKLFAMPKFRSMRTDTPVVATHLLTDSRQWITPLGHFLRKTSLDELPQLWSILVGDMSFVGPRPALFNQHDLVELRTARGVDQLRPGLTGWAQVNGRDELSIPEKVRFDEDYLARQSLWLDLKIIALTFIKVAIADGIQQADKMKGLRVGG